jgi:hypothetical protein
MQIEIDLSNFQDIYEMSHELQFGVGIDACREYVDETLSPETASMLLSMYAPPLRIRFGRFPRRACLQCFESAVVAPMANLITAS